jgi:hypothetical protein
MTKGHEMQGFSWRESIFIVRSPIFLEIIGHFKEHHGSSKVRLEPMAETFHDQRTHYVSRRPAPALQQGQPKGVAAEANISSPFANIGETNRPLTLRISESMGGRWTNAAMVQTIDAWFGRSCGRARNGFVCQQLASANAFELRRSLEWGMAQVFLLDRLMPDWAQDLRSPRDDSRRIAAASCIAARGHWTVNRLAYFSKDIEDCGVIFGRLSWGRVRVRRKSSHFRGLSSREEDESKMLSCAGRGYAMSA